MDLFTALAVVVLAVIIFAIKDYRKDRQHKLFLEEAERAEWEHLEQVYKTSKSTLNDWQKARYNYLKEKYDKDNS